MTLKPSHFSPFSISIRVLNANGVVFVRLFHENMYLLLFIFFSSSLLLLLPLCCSSPPLRKKKKAKRQRFCNKFLINVFLQPCTLSRVWLDHICAKILDFNNQWLTVVCSGGWRVFYLRKFLILFSLLSLRQLNVYDCWMMLGLPLEKKVSIKSRDEKFVLIFFFDDWDIEIYVGVHFFLHPQSFNTLESYERDRQKAHMCAVILDF